MACELIVCGSASDPAASAEFADGLARLKHQAGPLASWHFVPPGSGRSLFETALAEAQGRPDSDRVLLLAHAQLLVADGTLALLAGALEDGADIALCYGAAHPPAHLPPDYCTVRGLERYAHAMARVVAGESVILSRLEGPATGDCLASMTRLGALRAVAQGLSLRGRWQPGCFVHDFSAYHQGFQGRSEMVDWIPMGAHRVLDVGGGEGHFLHTLRTERGCETHLSEFSSAICALAASRVDHAWPGDFLDIEPTGLPDGGRGAFDAIAFLDSLEHAPEPARWLAKAHSLLRDGGAVVGSVPNVGHWSVLADLMEGRWDYCPVGIHCVTHLRFFTRRTLLDLLDRSGFVLESIETTTVASPPSWKDHWLATPGLKTESAEMDAYAFVFRAVKRPAGQAT